MAASMNNSMLSIAVRGSQGLSVTKGAAECQIDSTFPQVRSRCKCMAYSANGKFMAFCDGNSVVVVEPGVAGVLHQLDHPRTSNMALSPTGARLLLWEPFNPALNQTYNMHIYDTTTGQLVKGIMQKKQTGWSLSWVKDESLSARLVNNEVHFYENNNFDEPSKKLHLAKVAACAIPTKATTGPYHCAIYIPGSKGQPSLVRIFKYPEFSSPVANKSFFKSDRVEMEWNYKGTSLLVLSLTDSSTDNSSYYGDQGLHYMDVKGETCLIPRSKNGPVYSMQWSPSSQNEFVIVYGFMPAKATLFNSKCEPVFDFGTGPRNEVYFNRFGNIMCLAGFGNLRGNVEMWDMKQRKLITTSKAPDSSYFEWAPDGVHWLTATTAPRLRVGNGFKIWNYSGSLLYETTVPADQELWEVKWRPAADGVFQEQRISYASVQSASAAPQAEKAAPQRYVPPSLRGLPEAQQAPAGPRYRDIHAYEQPTNLKQAQNTESMSKQALKNKKKREAKKAKAQQEADEEAAAAAAAAAMVAPGSGDLNPSLPAQTGDPETDKKIRNIKKKLQQIEKLKERKAAGETLEKNQVDKLSTEAALLKELQDLTL